MEGKIASEARMLLKLIEQIAHPLHLVHRLGRKLSHERDIHFSTSSFSSGSNSRQRADQPDLPVRG